MFKQDTKIVLPPTGTPSSKITNIQCGPGELLTGLTARTSGASPDVLNRVDSIVCTDWKTGAKRTVSNMSAGNTNSGNTKVLSCPSGSYAAAVTSNWRGWSGSDKVSSGIGLTCKDFQKKQTYNDKAGNEVLYPGGCADGYYLNELDFTSGDVVNTVKGVCINMNPRINVLNNTSATQACCMGTGDASLCAEYTPQSGKCDAYFVKKCVAGSTDPLCGCFSVPAGIPPCYATKCLEGGYMTQNMKSSCPTQYINCDAQLVATNTGTQLSGSYNMQQNCGASANTPGTSTGTATGTTTGSNGTTTTTTGTTGSGTGNTSAGGNTGAIGSTGAAMSTASTIIANYGNMFIIFVFVLAFGFIGIHLFKKFMRGSRSLAASSNASSSANGNASATTSS